MKRRNFLGSLIAVPVAAKSIVLKDDIPEVTIPLEKVKVNGNELDLQSQALTDDFFTYIKWNKTKFDWRQMQAPADVFDAHPVIIKTRRIEYFMGIPIVYTERTKDEKLDIVKHIVKELETEYRIDNLKAFYFYTFAFTPIIYDPETFEPMRGIFIRYARRGK